MKKTALAIICSAALLSCQSKPDAVRTWNTLDLGWPFTKGGTEQNYTDSTFRAILYSSTNGEQSANGSYCLPKDGNTWLTPCKVQNSGGHYVYLEDDRRSGLIYHSSGKAFNLILATPAVPITNYGTSKQPIWGVLQDRVVGSSGERTDIVFFSEPIPCTLNSYELSGYNIFPIPDTIRLIEHRSRINVTLECSEELRSATVNSSRIVDLIDKAYYHPERGDYDESAHTISDPITLFDTPVTVTKDDEKPYEVCTGIYILSEDYSATFEDDERGLVNKYTVPKLEFDLAGRTCTVPLNFKMQPQYEYSLKVIVRSVYLTVTLTVTPWNEGTGKEEEIGTYPAIDLGMFYPVGWEDGTGGKGNGTIDD